MRRLALAFAAAGLLAAPALAQDWTLDRAASTVGFTTTAFGAPVSGAFEDFDAAITLDPDALETARIEASVSTGSGAIGNAEQDNAMKGRAGLAPEEHPLARFVSEDIRRTDEGYEAHGVLTIKGQDRPQILPFTLAVTDGRAVADGAFILRRADFGVGAAGWGDVATEVTVVLHIEADATQ